MMFARLCTIEILYYNIPHAFFVSPTANEFEVRSVFKMAFDFRTTNWNGVLMSISDPRTYPALGLEMVGGQVSHLVGPLTRVPHVAYRILKMAISPVIIFAISHVDLKKKVLAASGSEQHEVLLFGNI